MCQLLYRTNTYKPREILLTIKGMLLKVQVIFAILIFLGIFLSQELIEVLKTSINLNTLSYADWLKKHF